MPTYSYQAINTKGSQVKGKLTAANELDLEERLEESGLTLISQKVVKQRKTKLFKQVKSKDLIMMCIHLEQLDRAGVPLLDSLADLRDSADVPAFRDLISDIYEQVKGGELLSVAMAKRSDVFDEVFIG